MLLVGLTGGIGSGKSGVAEVMRRYGAHILDADHLAREITSPGSPALTELVEAFGPDCLTETGELDRKRLAEITLSAPERRRLLEVILHPRINSLAQQRAGMIGEHSPGAIVIYEAALLLESGAERLVDRVVVVDLPEILQFKRASARGDRDPEQIRTMIARQWPRSKRLQYADDIIDNSGTWTKTEQQVVELMVQYRELAQTRPRPSSAP